MTGSAERLRRAAGPELDERALIACEIDPQHPQKER
jgi:hypothetical protein